jgi:hypothetical protein
MNVDLVLETLGRNQVDFLLIGGMNFLLRHEPVLTFDIDVWVNDTQINLDRCELAMIDLDASWGATEETWRPVKEQTGWTRRQSVFCLVSPHASVDVFRTVAGLASWAECKARAYQGKTKSGVEFFGLSDADMVACQLALPSGTRKYSRIETLRKALGEIS